MITLLDHSFATFLYPFRFDPDSFEDTIQGVIADQVRNQPVWIPHVFQNEDLLPHVANFLNAPKSGVSAAAQRTLVASWDMARGVLELREMLAVKGEWTLKGQGSESDLPIRLTEINLTIFRLGVGFFRFRVEPVGCRSLETWQEFLHVFRFLEGGRSRTIEARRKTGKEQWESIRPGLLGTPGEGADPYSFRFGEVVRALESRYLRGLKSSIYITGQAIPYSGLFIDGLPSDRRMHLLHQIKNCFKPSQGEAPAAWELDPSSPEYVQYTDGSWFVLSLDGASFVGFDLGSTPFYTTTLPGHLLCDQYYLIYLLVQQQRSILMDLSTEVADYWDEKNPRRQEARFDRLRNRLMLFTSNGYFSQVMQREHHHRLYRAWQDKLQISTLYQEVAAEIHGIHERLVLMVQEGARNHGDRLNRIVFLLAPPTILLAILQTYSALVGLNLGRKWALAILVISALIGLGVGALFIRTRRK